ncbi:hypothetical protein CUPS4066_06100, partial [Campylobacter upsaliensis]|nr:hypothetical protein [Campylobacter upsaliensis]
APLFIQANSSEFILKQGGGLFVTTLKGAITGFHADSILIDDPIKVENMKSKKEREFVNIGKNLREFLKENEPFIDTNGARLYEWEKRRKV